MTGALERGSPGLAPAPDFTLDSVEGGSFWFAAERGERVAYLDFWATWCAPCKAAMPALEALSQRYAARGLLLVGISIDGPESAAEVRSTAARHGLSFPVLLDPEASVLARFSPSASPPFGVLIARDGRVLSQREGFGAGDHQRLEREIALALAANPEPVGR